LSLNGRRFEGLPNRRLPLDEVRERMLRRRCLPRTRDAVWSHLVRRSRQEGATWTVACAGMALPALTGVARWLGARYPGEPFDVQAEVLSGFLDGVGSVDLAKPHVLPRLRWAAYRQGYAALTAALDAPDPVAARFGPVTPHVPWGHPDLVLARAVREDVLSQVEAELIGATRLEQVPVAAWAGQHAMTPGAAYKARRRAERRLVAFIREQVREADPDDPVAALALDRLGGSYARAGHAGRKEAGREGGEEVTPVVSKTGPNSGLGMCGRTSPAPAPASTSEDAPCA
jgi:hypothetical protein